MKIGVSYYLSEKGQKAALSAGENAASKQSTVIDDPESTLIERVWVDSSGGAHIDLTGHSLELVKKDEYFDHNVHKHVFLPEAQRGYKHRLDLDAPLHTLDDLRAAISAYDRVEADLIASIPFLQAQEDARFEAKKAAYLEKKAAEDAERAERERKEAEAEARKKEAREKAEAAKQAWVAEFGSEHLKKACVAGYDCQRLYVTERAALDLPGYSIDFDDGARWTGRSCPSEAALNEALIAGGTVVWLKEPGESLRKAWDMEADEEYGTDPFDPCEAVVVEGYLGKYDLIKTMG